MACMPRLIQHQCCEKKAWEVSRVRMEDFSSCLVVYHMISFGCRRFFNAYDAAYDHGSFLQFRVLRSRTCSGLGSRSRPSSLTDKNTCGLGMLGRLGTPLIGSVGLPRFDYWMSLGTWPCTNYSKNALCMSSGQSLLD